MVNFRIISKILGSLLLLEAFLMLCCLAVAMVYEEDDVMAFLMSTLLTNAGAFAFLGAGRTARNTLSRRDAYVVVTAVWTVFSIFGTLPLLIHGAISNPADALFETMSGFTATGASIINDVEAMPHGILFWRSLMQWIGGLGIVFFTIAILPSFVGGSVKVFAAEATGPMQSKLHPRLSTTAKWIWSIYVVLTVACALSFWLTGMPLFDAVNHAMTATATGGFTTRNDGLLHFGSPAIEYESILFEFLSGINFTLLYVCIFKRQMKSLFTNSELRFYMGTVVCCTAVVFAFVYSQGFIDIETAFRRSLFQVVSALTTTGFSIADVGLWPIPTWGVLFFCMFVGACAGSTTGGFKCVRGVMLFKVMRGEFLHLLHPNAVLPVKMNDQDVPRQKLVSLLAFFTITLVLMFAVIAVMVANHIDIDNATTIALSLLSNAGAGLNTHVGPLMSWADLSSTLKLLGVFIMLAGRLEIFSVLVLFTPSFWKEN